MERKNLPRVPSPLRDHIVEMPQAIFACTGVVIHGRRIKSLVFSTDIAIIRNCNADAVLAVPFVRNILRKNYSYLTDTRA